VSCVVCEHACDTLPVGQLLIGDFMKVVIESERDRRTLNWLVLQVGEDKVAAACDSLAGERRAYVSNVAKALGLEPPLDLLQTPTVRARQELLVIKNLLRKGSTSC